MPFLSAQQVPQFDNWNFDDVSIPTFCGSTWLPSLEACGTDVKWWVWQEPNKQLSKLCFPYDELSQYYVDGSNEFSIQVTSDIRELLLVDVIKESFEYSTLQDVS